jgi:hypothetical protein
MEGWTMMMQLDALFDGFLLRFGFTWVAFLIMLSVILYVFLVELKETMKGGCLLRIMKQTKKETMDGSRVFHSCDYRRKKPVAGEGQPATPAPCAAAAERRAINL